MLENGVLVSKTVNGQRVALEGPREAEEAIKGSQRTKDSIKKSEF